MSQYQQSELTEIKTKLIEEFLILELEDTKYQTLEDTVHRQIDIKCIHVPNRNTTSSEN